MRIIKILQEGLKWSYKANSKKINPLALFELLRVDYYSKFAGDIKNILVKGGIETPTINCSEKQKKLLYRIINNKKLYWQDTTFHLKYRVQDVDDLIELKPELNYKRSIISNIIEKKNYLLSILPLNLLLGKEVLYQFIPPEDFSTPHALKDIDPYGIATADSKVISNDMWICSKKFKNTILMNIHGHCPIGCSDCYKSHFTRERGNEDKLGAGDTYETSPVKLEKQVKLLVKWLNRNPNVYDIIISGGEPFLRSNNHIELMLKEMRGAKNLRILRFCTAAIFLGLPFRIDDELLDIIVEFTKDTGIKITFQAHLSNHLQITPEAVIAVNKIKKRGFNIYSQTPIKEGINFFTGDYEKSKNFLRELVKRQFFVGVEPYKFIVDMHPRTLSYHVPIEPLIKVFSHLFDTHLIPELERPKTLSILTKQGNIILSGHSLFAIKKEVNNTKKIVRYQIPKVCLPSDKIEVQSFIYEEPLSPLNEDPNSLDKIRSKWFKTK